MTALNFPVEPRSSGVLYTGAYGLGLPLLWRHSTLDMCRPRITLSSKQRGLLVLGAVQPPLRALSGAYTLLGKLLWCGLLLTAKFSACLAHALLVDSGLYSILCSPAAWLHVTAWIAH